MADDDDNVVPFERPVKEYKFPIPGACEGYEQMPSMEELYYQLGLKLENPALLEAIKNLSFESPWFKFVAFRASTLTMYEDPEYYEGKPVPDYIYKVVMYLDPLRSVGGPILNILFYGRADKQAKDVQFPYFPTATWKDKVEGSSRLFEFVLRDIKAYHEAIRDKQRVQVVQSADARNVTFHFIDYEATRVVFEILDEEQDDE